MVKQRIRPLAICVFSHQQKILVFKGYDPIKKQIYYRPLGGGIHFSETSEAALHREIYEELGVEICDVRLLGVKENIFIYDGQPGHEIVFIYDAHFNDESVYSQEVLEAHEDDQSPFKATWIDVKLINQKSTPIYPEGLLELISEGI